MSVSPPEVTAEQAKSVLAIDFSGDHELRCQLCELMHLTIGGEDNLGFDLGYFELQKSDEETPLIEMAAASILHTNQASSYCPPTVC